MPDANLFVKIRVGVAMRAGQFGIPPYPLQQVSIFRQERERGPI